MKSLSFFTTLSVPEELREVFKSFEDILQVEHGVDGTHERVNSTRDGYMTAEDKQKLDLLYQFIQDNKTKIENL